MERGAHNKRITKMATRQLVDDINAPSVQIRFFRVVWARFSPTKLRQREKLLDLVLLEAKYSSLLCCLFVIYDISLTLANGLVVPVAFMTVGFFPLQTSRTRPSDVRKPRALGRSIP